MFDSAYAYWDLEAGQEVVSEGCEAGPHSDNGVASFVMQIQCALQFPLQFIPLQTGALQQSLDLLLLLCLELVHARLLPVLQQLLTFGEVLTHGQICSFLHLQESNSSQPMPLCMKGTATLLCT